jgi:hypothetical protein
MQCAYLFLICLSLLLSLSACADKKVEEQPPAVRATADLPYGTWQVVDLMGVDRGDWTAILMLDRFTYSWTTLVPPLEAVFYEAGDVTYDTKERRIRFVVKTSKAMDQQSGIPKEMTDDPRRRGLRHAPGDEYHMTWGVGDDVLVLNGPTTEITYLRRLKTGPADSSVIDVQRGK